MARVAGPPHGLMPLMMLNDSIDTVARTIHPLENLADQRVEQAGVDHQAEEQDGEQQQRGRRCDHFQPIEHHLAQVWRETANKGENNRHDGQRDDR